MKDKPTFALYSRCVKAGKRFYYIDAKRDSKGNDYMVITESNSAEEGGPMTRHKIFLYQEDFYKFTEAFLDVLKSFDPDQNPPLPTSDRPIDVSAMEEKLSDLETTVVDDTTEDSIFSNEEPLKIDFDF